ncbi:MAG: lipase family protein [Candidatus Heimdallarchaeota archaeon]|nr:lipase family protein [Candidatus Heimdallarchaeota archaeon]
MSVPPSFSLDTAKLLIEFSIAAYEDDSSSMNIPEGYTYVKLLDSKETDTQCLVAKGHENIVIAFRGTTSFKDVESDLEVFKAIFPSSRGFFNKSKVHQGFLDAYLDIKDKLIHQIKELQEQEHFKAILLTGHSLGGALATLCALDLKIEKIAKNVVMYNYGSPRVGNSKFVDKYMKTVDTSYRIVNDEDFVPQLPPGTFFDHVPIYTLIDEGNKLVFSPSTLEQIEKNLEGTASLATGVLKEHRSQYYRELLNNIEMKKRKSDTF